jgi:hypothetical protein
LDLATFVVCGLVLSNPDFLHIVFFIACRIGNIDAFQIFTEERYLFVRVATKNLNHWSQERRGR